MASPERAGSPAERPDGEEPKRASILGKRPLDEDEDLESNEAGVPKRTSQADKASSPPLKKARISGAEVAEGSSDEGEIVEGESDAKPHNGNGDKSEDDPKHSVEGTDVADGADAVDVKQAEQVGWNQGVSGGLRISFGGIPKLAEKRKRKSGGSASESLPDQPQDLPSSDVEEGEVEQDSGLQEEPVKTASTSANQTTTTTRENSPEATMASFTTEKHGRTWQLPALADPGPNQSRSWQDRFVLWCTQFFEENLEGIKHFSPKFARFMFITYLGLTQLKKSHKKRATLAADLALQSNKIKPIMPTAVDGANIDNAEAHTSKMTRKERKQRERAEQEARQKQQQEALDVQPQDAPVPHEPKQLTREVELEELARYFPGIPADSDFCIYCATHGHRANDCPETICEFCQETDHLSPQCPTRQRCTKCKGLGHSYKSCTEKLILPASEQECAICTSLDHLEPGCTEVWRSCRPGAGGNPIRQVNEIKAFCYNCGAEGHWGGDCPTNTGYHVSGREFVKDDGTWTAAACEIFVDPNSENIALDWAPPLPPEAELPPYDRPNIPGRSIVPRMHIHFGSDDEGDDGEGFIRDPVRLPPKQSGGIRIAGLAAAQQQGRAANGLPPRPTNAPPGPQGQGGFSQLRNNGYGHQQQNNGPQNGFQGQGGALPPRPNAPGRGGSNQGRGGNNARGGGGRGPGAYNNGGRDDRRGGRAVPPSSGSGRGRGSRSRRGRNGRNNQGN